MGVLSGCVAAAVLPSGHKAGASYCGKALLPPGEPAVGVRHPDTEFWSGLW